MDFPPDFLATIAEEKSPGQSLFSSVGNSIFQFLSRSGILAPFNGLFDSKISEVIREAVLGSMDQIPPAERSSLTLQRYFQECFTPNRKWMLRLIKRSLLDFFDQNEQLTNNNTLQDLVGQYQAFVASGETQNGVEVARVSVQQQIAEAVKEVLARERMDGKTGLGGPKAFKEHIKYLRENRPGDPFTVLYIDLDHFKQVNDRMGGHAGGDQVLRRAGNLIQHLVREGGAFRVGGEELVVILEGNDEVRAVRQFAEAFRTGLQREVFQSVPTLGSPSKPFHVTASIGVAFGLGEDLFELEEDTPMELAARSLLHLADTAQYRAKGKVSGQPDDPMGRNRIWVHGKDRPEPRTEDTDGI